MLEKNQFKLLNYLYKNETKHLTQRTIAEALSLSLGTINAVLSSLQELNYINYEYKLTKSGINALKPYKVQNAIIMAAGLSPHSIPVSCAKPKGLYVVRGEVLIERQIRQLQQAGIENIIIVVGYMMEQFFYLEDKFNVTILVNSNYASRNNNGTLYTARAFLGNSYICSSDNYFTENVFEQYVYDSYYASVYKESSATALYVKLDNNNRITKAFRGGQSQWALIGHAYLSNTFCKKYIKYLLDMYDIPETKSDFWEWVFYPHLKEMTIYARKYNPGIIYEFNSLMDIQEFDNSFINNIDDTIIENICHILHCKSSDIANIRVFTAGKVDISISFSVNQNDYIYQKFDESINNFINLGSELYSLQKAKELNLDLATIYLDSSTGFKLSKYQSKNNCFNFDKLQDIAEGIKLLKTLHHANIISPYTRDILKECHSIYTSMSASVKKRIQKFKWLYELMDSLFSYINEDGWQKCLCHGNPCTSNFIYSENQYNLTGWEYSGNCDIGFDIAQFCIIIEKSLNGNDRKLTRHAIEYYFDRHITDEEYRHVAACFALSEYYWFVWSLSLTELGQSVETNIFRFYKNACTYGKLAFDLYTSKKIPADT